MSVVVIPNTYKKTKKDKFCLTGASIVDKNLLRYGTTLNVMGIFYI